MRRGFLNHLDLTASDLSRSTEFYARVLGHLGYRLSTEYVGDVPNWILDSTSPSFSFGLHEAKRAQQHDRYSPGLHHVAFHVESRSEVDAMYALLTEMSATILDPPAEYDYTTGYYAVFFADPDGMKLEVVYEPRLDERAV